jgi:GcrA cell cycle regulator
MDDFEDICRQAEDRAALDGSAPRRHAGYNWPPSAIERLRALVAKGWTYSMIALELGMTRNAVIGKANRLGLCIPRPKPKPARGRIRARKRRLRTKPQPQEATVIVMPPPPRPEPVHPEHSSKGLLGGPCTIMDLDRHRCRWPLWDHVSRVPFSEQFYCGEATAAAGLPYCGEHTRMAYHHGSGVARWR